MQVQLSGGVASRTGSASLRRRVTVAAVHSQGRHSASARTAARGARKSPLHVAAAAGPEGNQVDAEEQKIENLEKRFRPFDPASVKPPPQRFGKQEPVKPKPMSERIAGKDFYEASWEVWSGEEGVLWWANKLAYASVFVLIGAWIVFRFIGPASGLYELKAGFTEVPTSIN